MLVAVLQVAIFRVGVDDMLDIVTDVDCELFLGLKVENRAAELQRLFAYRSTQDDSLDIGPLLGDAM
jgi:hypothetical protein